MNETVTLTALFDGRCRDKSHEKADVYRMVGYCSNCQTQGILGLFTVGHETSHYGPCPLCGAHFRLGWKRLATADEIPAAVKHDQ